MNGINCPSCGRPTDWGSTTNEWQYICKPCDARWNRDGLRMPPFAMILRFGKERDDAPYTSTVPFGYFGSADADVVDHGGGADAEPAAPTRASR